MAEFLFEIGLEEVPARMIAGAQAELLRRVTSLFCSKNLMDSGDVALAKSYSTPRRLAVHVPNVFERQADSFAKVLGPSTKVAFKDGVPTPAAEAFARKNGLAVADLKIETTEKGEYVIAETQTKGRSTAEVIASELPKELAGLYWAKNMRWIPGSTERFVRPVLWMLCLLAPAQDDTTGMNEAPQVVPVRFGGKTAGRATFGHRVLSSGEAFEVVSPGSYVAQLEGEFVLADVEVRRQKIRKAMDRVTRGVPGARWREDEALVDQVTHLTEWPDVLLGDFEAAYLELPEEVLVTVMRDHQKYFAVESADGKLAPHFLAVVNIGLTETNAAIIRQGNERVLRARFNDARFFWEFDQRTPLVERVKLLENVTFQKELGSYAAKSERVRALASSLAAQVVEAGGVVHVAALDEAVTLAKTDLTTELVKEFTELQGVIGGLYAKSQGVSQTAYEAIYDQYTPASMEDGVPRSVEGALLGIADRADTIAGMFGLGMEPTGSKDPFALRRAANGIVKILAETALPLTLDVIARAAAKDDATAARMATFFRERVEFYLREVRGQAYDVVSAVLAAGGNDVRDAQARAEAVTAMRGGEDFAAVAAAFKRMKNILAQAQFETSLTPFMHAGVEAEDNLYTKFRDVEDVVKRMSAKRQYELALESVATLRPEVDAFFEKVMVNDPDETVRRRRLTLLSEIVESLGRFADFSQIVVAG